MSDMPEIQPVVWEPDCWLFDRQLKTILVEKKKHQHWTQLGVTSDEELKDNKPKSSGVTAIEPITTLHNTLMDGLHWLS